MDKARDVLRQIMHEAARNEDPRPLLWITEATLKRIFQHINADAGFAIVTSDRGDRKPELNNKLRKGLTDLLQSMNYGFIRTKGGWQDPATGEVEFERSFVIPQVSKEQAWILAKKLFAIPYNQDAIIWGSGNGVFLLWNDDTAEWIGTGPDEGTIHKAFTEWRGRRFTFRMFEYIPSGQIDGYAWNRILGEVRDLRRGK